MAEIIPLRDDPHRDIELLLPWYASGELEGDDTITVEAHLEACAQCRSALETERRMAGAVKRLPLHSDLGWEKLQRRLAPDLAAQPPRSRRILRPWRKTSPRAAFAGLAAAQVALLAVAFLFAYPAETPAPRAAYRTLGAPATHAAGNAIVIFRPETSEQALRQALAVVDARLVDGPTPAGAYVLRIPPGGREAALKALRARHEVVLAQSIGPERPQ